MRWSPPPSRPCGRPVDVRGGVIETETLWQLVEQRAAATPESLFALDEDGGELSFEALRHEVKHFNIQVSLVEPGFIRTNLAHNGQLSANAISNYEHTREKTFEAVQKQIAKAPEATLVAETIERIIKSQITKIALSSR